MTTNTVPSLDCKGNGKTIGFYDSKSYFGVSYLYGEYGGQNTNLYDKNIGQAGYAATNTKNGLGIGITSDATKSGIITNTGTMSAISSRAIIKY